MELEGNTVMEEKGRTRVRRINKMCYHPGKKVPGKVKVIMKSKEKIGSMFA